MTKMLAKLELNLEGKHHSGIDDCHNSARIFIELVEKGLNKQNILDNMQYVVYDSTRHRHMLTDKNRPKYNKKHEVQRKLNKEK